MRNTRLFTSESVTEGHPDKICDQVSDAILDAILAEDVGARVAVETMVTTGLVHVAGEIRTEAYVEIPEIVRRVITDIGYTSSDIGFDGRSCGVSVSIGAQSPEIAEGVDTALETRSGLSDDALDRLGAGDQGIMFGYACTETEDLLPMPIWLAHRLARQLADVRKSGVLPYLRPDGKTQVTIGYDHRRPVTLDTVVLSAQHAPGIEFSALQSDLQREVIDPVLRGVRIDRAATRFLINPSGSFLLGGPAADAGLTGRKIIVDTYGGAARHGGGAFSGKDPSKVDRSGAYALRWAAKNAVAAGLADKLELQIAYAIGKSAPVGLYVESFGTGTISDEAIIEAILDVFDFRPAAIIRDLELLQPIYRQTAAYGHFGRSDIDLPWERLNRVDDLRIASGV